MEADGPSETSEHLTATQQKLKTDPSCYQKHDVKNWQLIRRAVS